MSATLSTPGPAPVTLAQAHGVWAGIGLRSFGGPTAQIALMHRVLVEERRWLSDREFLDALGFCMLLPGPEAMQLATYAGWKMHGLAGGLAAGLWFVLPGALVVLALSAIYSAFGHVPWIVAAFAGIKATVLVLVIEAMLRIGRRALVERRQVWVAAASLLSLGIFSVPYPLVVLAAGLLGWAWSRGARAEPRRRYEPVPIAATARTVVVWLAIWALPLLGVAAAFGPRHVLSQLAWFFSKLAVVTFGGAYAVLGYMSQDVVTRHGWLTAGQMLDGLGLAETTPGPLILVTEFVGFVAAYRAHPEAAMAFGFAGAAVALWATFAPCFLWVFLGGPYVERLRGNARLASALQTVTAAVVGVIANLAVSFAIVTLFREVRTVSILGGEIPVPVWSEVDPFAVAVAAFAFVSLRFLHWHVVPVILASALAGLVVKGLL